MDKKLTEEELHRYKKEAEMTPYSEPSYRILRLLSHIERQDRDIECMAEGAKKQFEHVTSLGKKIEEQAQEIERLKPKPVICNKGYCKSPSDDYVGMHMTNEECPACNSHHKQLVAKAQRLEEALENMLMLAYDTHLPIKFTGELKRIYEKAIPNKEVRGE
jgi:hypothetical protein